MHISSLDTVSAIAAAFPSRSNLKKRDPKNRPRERLSASTNSVCINSVSEKSKERKKEKEKRV